jgi:tetratricopeptide (TPR) repeat protein
VRHALTLACVLVAATATASPSSPKDEFDDAKQSFRSKNCAAARPELKDLLFPEKLSAPEQLAEAYVMLGACQLEDQQPEEAKQQFQKALQIDPDIEVDPQFFSSTAVRSFDIVKADLDAQAKNSAASAAAEQLRKSLRTYEHHPLWENLVPFGLGQYNNHNYTRAGLVAGGEVVTLATSFGIWFYLVEKYGVQSSNVELSDAQTVLWMQRIEIGTGIAFIGLYAYGVLDGFRHYKPDVQVVVPDSLLKELAPEPPPPKPAKTSFHILPLAVPNGGGIGLSWETP